MNSHPKVLTHCFLALLLVLSGKSVVGQDLSIPMTTSDRVLSKGWWPTKGTESRDQFVGAETCAGCHKQISETQSATAMAHASTAAKADKSNAAGPWALRLDPYNYQLGRSQGGIAYSVDDGIRTVATPLSWVFGSGHFGQTYVYEQKGVFYESHLSYYPGIHGLDFTTGHREMKFPDLDHALGTAQPPDTIRGCFGCHSTASTTLGHFDPSRLIPGISCEACHGPGAQHVAAMSLGKGEQSATFIMNPANLAASESLDFCGACHRTRLDTMEMHLSGVLNIRFPAYRLQASRCWGSQGDRRLTCMACHDAHVPLVSDATSYDKDCLSCHVTSGTAKVSEDHPGRACPVGRKECTTCHMPKYEIKEMHADFTDHKIAIHREGEPFTE